MTGFRIDRNVKKNDKEYAMISAKKYSYIAGKHVYPDSSNYVGVFPAGTEKKSNKLELLKELVVKSPYLIILLGILLSVGSELFIPSIAEVVGFISIICSALPVLIIFINLFEGQSVIRALIVEDSSKKFFSNEKIYDKNAMIELTSPLAPYLASMTDAQFANTVEKMSEWSMTEKTRDLLKEKINKTDIADEEFVKNAEIQLMKLDKKVKDNKLAEEKLLKSLNRSNSQKELLEVMSQAEKIVA